MLDLPQVRQSFIADISGWTAPIQSLAGILSKVEADVGKFATNVSNSLNMKGTNLDALKDRLKDITTNLMEISRGGKNLGIGKGIVDDASVEKIRSTSKAILDLKMVLSSPLRANFFSQLRGAQFSAAVSGTEATVARIAGKMADARRQVLQQQFPGLLIEPRLQPKTEQERIADDEALANRLRRNASTNRAKAIVDARNEEWAKQQLDSQQARDAFAVARRVQAIDKGKGFFGRAQDNFKDFLDSSFGKMGGSFMAFHQLRRSIEEAFNLYVQWITQEKAAVSKMVSSTAAGISSIGTAITEGFGKMFQGLAGAIRRAFTGLMYGDIVGSAIDSVGTAINESLSNIGRMFIGTMTGVVESVSGLVGAGGSFLAAGMRARTGLAGNVISGAGAATSLGMLASGVGAPTALITMTATAIAGEVVKGVGEISAAMQEASFQFAASVIGSIGGMFGQIVSKVIQTLNESLTTSINAVAGFVGGMAKQGIEVDRLQTTFGSLVGDLKDGESIFRRVSDMAIVRPYTVKTVSDAAEQLLSMGVSAKSLEPTLARLGDIALGNDAKFKKLAMFFAEIAEGGTLTQFRLREFSKMGITANDFAETMKISVAEFQQLMSMNLVGGDALIETINRLTNAGGRLHDTNKKLMETAYGQWHRLSSIIDVIALKMGKAFNENSGLVAGLKAVGDFFEKNISVFERLASQMGAIFGNIAREFGILGQAILPVGIQNVNIPQFDIKPAITGFLSGIESVLQALESFRVAILETVGVLGRVFGGLVVKIGDLLHYLGSAEQVKQALPPGMQWTHTSPLRDLFGEKVANELSWHALGFGVKLRKLGGQMENWAGPNPNFGVGVFGNAAAGVAGIRQRFLNAPRLPFHIQAAVQQAQAALPGGQVAANVAPGAREVGEIPFRMGNLSPAAKGVLDQINKMQVEGAPNSLTAFMTKMRAVQEIKTKVAMGDDFKGLIAPLHELVRKSTLMNTMRGLAGGPLGAQQIEPQQLIPSLVGLASGVAEGVQNRTQRKRMLGAFGFDEFKKIEQEMGMTEGPKLSEAMTMGSKEALQTIFKASEMRQEDMTTRIVNAIQRSIDIEVANSKEQAEFSKVVGEALKTAVQNQKDIPENIKKALAEVGVVIRGVGLRGP